MTLIPDQTHPRISQYLVRLGATSLLLVTYPQRYVVFVLNNKKIMFSNLSRKIAFFEEREYGVAIVLENALSKLLFKHWNEDRELHTNIFAL